jgi:ribosome-associated translation inhibitor RaiA
MSQAASLRGVKAALKNPMRVETTGPVFESRHELQGYVERRLLSALGHLARHVDHVAVRGDVVERRLLKGGVRCRIVARLVCGRELVEEEVDNDPHLTIDRAAEALARDVDYVESLLPPGGGLRCA